VNNAGGTIEADSSSTVTPSNVVLNGGSLTSLNGGAIQGGPNTNLNGVTITPGSVYTIPGGGINFVLSDLTNQGTVNVCQPGSDDGGALFLLRKRSRSPVAGSLNSTSPTPLFPALPARRP
jgi:hypothetical protein